jgi:translocator protein
VSEMAMAIALAAGWTVAVLGAGGAVTEIGAWYRALRKPSWQPPDWLFGPAWTTIFVLASVAFVRAWTAPEAELPQRTMLIGAFALNGVLNFLWSVLFFRLRRPDQALVEVAPLWISVVLMMAAVGRLDAPSAWLLAPYLAWVSFATVLNRTIVRLNGPFAPR